MQKSGASLAAIIAMSLASVTNANQLITPAAPVQDQYIVVLHEEQVSFGDNRNSSLPSVLNVAVDMSASHGLKYLRHYERVLPGFVVQAKAGQIDRLLLDPRVAYVEQDGVVNAIATQTGATWGLDRIDQRNLPLNTTYNYDTTASNVHAYIVDTGVLGSHTQFTGRMGNGYTAISDANGTNDCNGHGTHVAGTVAGTIHGVAKGAIIHPIRVLGCNGSGTNSGVIAGMDWVAQNRVQPAVANMSLGGGASQATDDAVNRMHNAGVTVVVAAGNDNANACNYSPARATNAITVGSTTSSDARSSFSNFGTCLDIFGPGSSITSAWHTGTSATNTISGTSMAAPHVAGVAALYLAANPSATPAQVTTALINNSTLNVVTNAGSGSPNRMLHSLFGGGPVNAPPTANFSFTTSGLTATFTNTSTDSDGTIASSAWNFGDSTTSTASNPSKTYAAAGTYTVTLTVTDNGGATNTTTRSVTVSSGGGGGGATALSNGVAVAGSTNSTSANSSFRDYTVAIPTGASNLVIATSGASGDVDLHVKFGAQATTSVYDCRPYSASGNETCTFATPSTGTYYARVYGYQTGTVNFTIRASWTTGGGGGTVVERLANGSFDSITTSTNAAPDGSWARSAVTGTSFNTLLAGQTNAQSGGSYAYLGVNNSAGQTVQSAPTLIPAGGSQATLSFYASIVTSETTTSTVYDRLQVQLVDAGTNAVITTLATLSNLNRTTSASTYVQRSYNVAAYKGRNVRVRFVASTDSSLPTTFRVDTVSLRSD